LVTNKQTDWVAMSVLELLITDKIVKVLKKKNYETYNRREGLKTSRKMKYRNKTKEQAGAELCQSQLS